MTGPVYPTQVYRIRLDPAGRDVYGNDVFTETTESVLAVAVWPLDVEEIADERQTVTSGVKMILPAGSDPPDQADAFLVDGRRYEVVSVRDWSTRRNPWTGDNAGVEVILSRVTG